MRAPSVEKIPGQPALRLGSFDVRSLGYDTNEYCLTGEALAFEQLEELRADGVWRVKTSESAEYCTRIVVLTPDESSKFNGSVIVEWLNVTGGLDMPADWIMTHREIMRSGYAYVAVSAQQVGVQGGLSLGADMSLKKMDPDRYARLHHPGDRFCFDIFTQAGHIIRQRPQEILGDLKPRHLLAIGESQSAMFLATYVNAVCAVYAPLIFHLRGRLAVKQI